MMWVIQYTLNSVQMGNNLWQILTRSYLKDYFHILDHIGPMAFIMFPLFPSEICQNEIFLLLYFVENLENLAVRFCKTFLLCFGGKVGLYLSLK